MGNFLVVIAPVEARPEADQLFRAGLANARQIKGLQPSGLIQSHCARAASFARRDGSGSSIIIDPETQSWLLAVGSWFHAGGCASGSEARLLRRMIEVGAERTAQELEGFFTIVFNNAVTHELFVVTDVIGSRHCFNRSIGQSEVISTSSLLAASLADCALDEMGCEEFLRTGIVYENRTFFRDVRKIGPAQIAHYIAGRSHRARRYWRLTELDPDKFEGKQAVRELSEKLIGAARKVRSAYANPVCDLTGGYDSRTLVAAFLAAGVDFETTVAGAADSPDVIVSKGLSRITGRPHWHFESETDNSSDRLREVLKLTDGGYDLVEYARIFSLHDRLSARFDVSINGSFGELARGYWWELLRPKIGDRQPLDAGQLARRRYVVDPVAPQLFSLSENERFVEHFTGVIERANRGLAGWPNTAQMDNTYLELRMQHWQGRIASSTDQIWPCLSPFMLKSVLETMLQIRVRLRSHSLLVRMMLAELQPELAAYPLEHGHPALPLTWRNWPRFIPLLNVYAKKARLKIEHRLFKGRTTAARTINIEPARMRLSSTPEVGQLLDPRRMRLAALIGEDRLADFLDGSRHPHFPFDQQWNRVLSLEMALREIEVSSSVDRAEFADQSKVGDAEITLKRERHGGTQVMD